ncbi:MAG: nicotinate-nucleotide adenylyltransferase [Candidatus Omnitrophica bacterium]|nr:nicotinate-nucleotide adenylyltransferase [Candidatus Omnitrophota bacterium]
MDKSGPKKRIGIFGGTFNPVHFGHLAIAAAAQEQVGLDLVIFIPAHVPPHKNLQNIIDSKLRYKMIQLAVKNNKNYTVSDIEIKKQTVSYSVDTLNRIKRIYPQAEVFFIIGSDSVPELKTWRLINEIFKLCCFVVAKRPDFEKFDNADLPENAIILNGVYPDISSTNIRELIKQGLAVNDSVPPSVNEFIKQNELYAV